MEVTGALAQLSHLNAECFVSKSSLFLWPCVESLKETLVESNSTFNDSSFYVFLLYFPTISIAYHTISLSFELNANKILLSR